MTRPIEILLVEDSPFDVRLTLQVLQEGTIPKHVSVVSNGEQALEFLRLAGAYADAPRPDLVLLDLNLPRRNGLEVLREIKGDPATRSITVIVLTTSESPIDVNTAYELNANCYVVKPLDYEQFVVTMRGIEDFWMGLASLPGLSPTAQGPEDAEEKGASANSGLDLKRSPTNYTRPHPIILRRRLRRSRLFTCRNRGLALACSSRSAIDSSKKLPFPEDRMQRQTRLSHVKT